MKHAHNFVAPPPYIPNRWVKSGNWWTLIRTMPDAPNIHCYGSGFSKKEAARMWVADWWRKQAIMANVARVS